MNIKGAIFDMDGTLLDSLGVWKPVWAAAGEVCGCPDFCPREEDFIAAQTMIWTDIIHMIRSKYFPSVPAQTLSDGIWNAVLDFYKDQVTVKPGALEFLEHLKTRGIKMCVASASEPEVIELALRHCGLTDYFCGLISCQAVGKGKESPEVFLAALELLGTAPEDTCLFEDSCTAIRTGVSIGLQTVGIYDQYNFCHEELARTAQHYIGPGETLEKLIV